MTTSASIAGGLGNDSVLFSAAGTNTSNTYFYEGGTDTLSFATGTALTTAVSVNTLTGAFASTATVAATGGVMVQGTSSAGVVSNLVFVSGQTNLSSVVAGNYNSHRLLELDSAWLITLCKLLIFALYREGLTLPFFMLDLFFFWPDQLPPLDSALSPHLRANILIRIDQFLSAESILLSLISQQNSKCDSPSSELFELYTSLFFLRISQRLYSKAQLCCERLLFFIFLG